MLKILEELLEAGELSKEVAEKIDGNIAPEFKKYRDENAKLRVKNKELSESLEDVNSSNEELKKQVQGLDERIAKAKEEGKSELVAQLEAERAEKQSLQEKLEAVSERNRTLTIENAISDALSGYDVIDSDLVKLALSQKVELGESGVLYKDGEKTLPLEDGVKAFFEAKQNLLKAQGTPGSGTAGGANTANFDLSKPVTEMSLEEKIAAAEQL